LKSNVEDEALSETIIVDKNDGEYNALEQKNAKLKEEYQ